MSSVMASLLGSAFGSMLGVILVSYIKETLPELQAPLSKDIDDVIGKLSPAQKIALRGLFAMLQQSFPEVANMGVTALVGSLVTRYPMLAPLQVELVSLFLGLDSEVEKDLNSPAK